jgi:hypothetical protein
MGQERVPRVVVCVPWRGGSPAREKAWAQTRAYYEEVGYPIYVSDSDPAKPFNLSQARNRAMTMAGLDAEVDVFIVSDADTVLSLKAITEAIPPADVAGCFVKPIQRLYYQRADGTWNDQPHPNIAGGVHVWGQAAWRVLSGYDERFASWGGEDNAVVWAAFTFHLLHVLDDGEAQAFWHPREGAAKGEEAWWSGVNEDLLNRYQAALRDPRAMRALLSEPDRWPDGSDDWLADYDKWEDRPGRRKYGPVEPVSEVRPPPPPVFDRALRRKR